MTCYRSAKKKKKRSKVDNFQAIRLVRSGIKHLVCAMTVTKDALYKTTVWNNRVMKVTHRFTTFIPEALEYTQLEDYYTSWGKK